MDHPSLGPEASTAPSKSSISRRILTPASILLGALMMSWPALWNGFPLLYPDSMTYLDDGRKVARALFLHQLSEYYGMRSFFYSLGILPFHWNLNPWPVVALQALLVAWVLWLVVRSVLPNCTPRRFAMSYLILVAALSLFTSLSWYVTLILPDILGPALYLAVYLLVFAHQTLTRTERWILYLIAWWGITSHASHLLLAAGLCVLLVWLWLVWRSALKLRIQYIGEIAAVILLAAASQLALNGYLNHELSLNGDRPPFLTARLIADGPGRWYLEKHCAEKKWVICNHLDHASSDPDNFLWGSDGVWQSLSDDENTEMLREELPFAIATIRAYPGAQLSRSAANFWGQLTTFGLDDLDPSGYVLDQFPAVLPSAKASYLRSRQAQNAMPLELFGSIHFWAAIVSLAVIASLLPHLIRNPSPRLIGLSAVMASMVVANAAITGTISMVEDRLQSRVVWLVPLLAGLLVLAWLNQWPRTRKNPR